MFARKRWNHNDSKDISSGIELTPTIRTCTLTKRKQAQRFPRSRRFYQTSHPKDDTSTYTDKSPKNLTTRSSNAHTCLSITGYVNESFNEHSTSSHMQTSCIMTNNISRLKTAHRFLSPIIDEIISRATSYTHQEFKDILSKRKPICSISYTQYIRAYQASEIISQVGQELRSVDFDSPYQANFTINNVQTIKKEELLENIERMADRIFIDRDLMKQLVNLHDLITETIDKLKHSLKQVSVEGIAMETNYRLMDSRAALEETPMKVMQFDRDTIRKDIAEHFIVLGEPKNKGCYCEDDTTYNLNTKSTVMQITVRDSREFLKENEFKHKPVVKLEEAPTKKPSKCSKKSCSPCPSKCKRKKKIQARDSVFQKKYVSTLGDDPEYTVTEAKREPTCVEDTTKACAVQPGEFEEDEIRAIEPEPVVQIDDNPLIVAESDSFEFINENERKARGQNDSIEYSADAARESYEDKGGGHWRPKRLTRATPIANIGTSCAEDCGEMGVGCSDIAQALRRMMATIADQLMILKDNDVIDFEEKDFIECDIVGVDKEYYTMQEVMYCLESIEQIRKRLLEMNFMEVSAEIPQRDDMDCCYRLYPHVHADVVGIPIIVKISQVILDLLTSDQPNQLNKLGTPDKPLKPGVESRKMCTCKPPTLKSLLKEKCALAKMIQSRHEAKQSNKVVMMTVHPMHEDIFGMRADSLLVESAFEARKPDVFQIMDMADSNTSLPYVVNRTSLPNITICRNLDITLPELRQQVLNFNVEHPKPRIEAELQSIGLENLLKAAIPAECCMPYALNRTDADNEPFHASLNSLPLTTSDLQLIADVVDEDAYDNPFCNYTPIHYYLTASIQFKYERYTNFQEATWGEKVIIMPPMCRVYLVYYFEIFKKDVEDAMHLTEVNEARQTNGKRARRKKSKPDGRFRSSQNATRRMVAKFFRRIVFSLPPEERTTFGPNHSEHQKSSRKKAKGRKTDKDKNVKPTRQTSSRKLTGAKSHRRLKNQRLQASASELDNYMQVHETILEENKNDNNIQYSLNLNQVPSTLNTFAVSTMTTVNSKRRLAKSKETRPNLSSTRLRSNQPSKLKKTASTAVSTSNSISNAFLSTSELRRSDCFLHANKELDESTGSVYEVDSDTGQRPQSHTRRELKADLGTIYESDEKLLSKESIEKETIIDFLHTNDYASLQRFVESEQAINIFEKSNIEPEQFWSMYFKQRREARLPQRSCSVASTIIPEMSINDDQPLSHVSEIEVSTQQSKFRSRIPRPIISRDKACINKASVDKLSSPSRLFARESIYSTEQSSTYFPNAPSRIIQINKAQDLHSRSEMFDETVEVASMHSVLANGPGYVTILHPACGCPEVSIFIPCYCGDKGTKRAGVTAKHVARMSANTNGRHILLPASCRIPKLKGAGLKGKPSVIKSRRRSQDPKYSKCYMTV